MSSRFDNKLLTFHPAPTGWEVHVREFDEEDNTLTTEFMAPVIGWANVFRAYIGKAEVEPVWVNRGVIAHSSEYRRLHDLSRVNITVIQPSEVIPATATLVSG